MNKIKGNIWVKFIVLLLAVALGSAAVLCGLATVLFGSDTDLQGTEEQIEEKLDERLLETYAAWILSNMDVNIENLDQLDGGNIRYTVVRREWEKEKYTQECLYTNDESVNEENCMVSLSFDGFYGYNATSFWNALGGAHRNLGSFYVEYNSSAGGYWLGHSFWEMDSYVQYTAYMSVGELWNRGGVEKPAKAPVLKNGRPDYTYDAARLAEWICRFRHTSGWWLLAFGICFLVCFLFLMNAAGCRSGEGQIRMRWIDKVPMELYLCAGGFLELGAVGLGAITLRDIKLYGSVSVSFGLGCVLLCLALGVFVALLLCMSFAVRTKARKFWRYTLAYYLFTPVAYFWGMARKNISILVKGLLLMGGVSVLELMVLILADSDPDMSVFFFFLYKLVEIPVVIHVLFQMNLLKKGGMRIAEGNYSEPIDTRHMLWEFRRHGENINSVGNGISLAVEARMKSERFKTELITNVSHDIKTPLTSIINYVDLMKKQEITDPTMREYMAVLERQSARLKKLIEDLMEASKASTGNLPVNLEECDAAVMLSQVVGEFEERAKANDLELIVTEAGEPAHIMADGRHLWRIFDNLMSNVCKYAMPGTRVYIDLERFHGMVIVTFRNISRSRLNVSSAELMERFVRGDSSRNTEGSGLGLSIAQSLANLMGGNMAIQIDGDLFKAIVSFEEKKE